MSAAAALAAALALLVPAGAAAGAEVLFPDRPVRLIVPFPPGGLNDIASQLVANQFTTLWNRPTDKKINPPAISPG